MRGTDCSPVLFVQEPITDVSPAYLLCGAERAEEARASVARGELPSFLGPDVVEATGLDDLAARIVVSEVCIHADDSINEIKRKFTVAAGATTPPSMIYAWSRRAADLSSTGVYQALTDSGRRPLMCNVLRRFALNVGIEYQGAPDASVCTFDDLMSLGIDSEGTTIVDVPFGHGQVGGVTGTLVADPMMAVEQGALAGRGEQLVDMGEDLLMLSTPLYGNVVWVWSAENLLREAVANGANPETIVSAYFPKLYDGGVRDLDSLAAFSQRNSGRDDALQRAFLQTSAGVDLLYEVASHAPDDLVSGGLTKVQASIAPPSTFNLPLDYVFKLLRAGRTTPMIKYNSGRRREKMYRLYADRTATDGRKIPHLGKSATLRLARTIGKTKGVTVCSVHDELSDYGTCEFLPSGQIIVNAVFNEPVTDSDALRIMQDTFGTTISQVDRAMRRSGYSLGIFDGLESPSVTIVSADYAGTFVHSGGMNLQPITACVGGAFAVSQPVLKKGLLMRLTRVANYSKMDGARAMIAEKLREGASASDIVDILHATESFGLTLAGARSELSSALNELQVVQDAFSRNKIRVRSNPGIPVSMTREQNSNEVRFEAKGMDAIQYAETLKLYIAATVMILSGEGLPQTTAGAVRATCGKALPDVVVPDERPVSAEARQSPEDPRPPTSREDVAHPEIPSESETPLGDDDPFEAASSTTPEPDTGPTALAPRDDYAFDLPPDESDPEQDLQSDKGGLMDFFLADSDSDESEDEDQEGGAGDTPAPLDVEGMPLSNPNPFFARMRARDPNLFLVENEGNFKAYSRLCAWNARRQPVILTNREKERIDAEHPGSYDHAIQYGSSEENQHWYICPRYWSLRHGVSLTEAQAKSGDYGSIVPSDAKKVPPGAGVFDFHRGSADEPYQERHPGFLKTDSHPDGLCVPCCFRQWDAPEQVKRRAECAGWGAAKARAEKDDGGQEEYIKGADKFPLEAGRYGYLPVPLQRFLRTDNRRCQKPGAAPTLKQGIPCLLRCGVQVSKSQSFVGAIATIFAEENGGEVLSIEAMKERIISALTDDAFASAQNGNLVAMFASAAIWRPLSTGVDEAREEFVKYLRSPDARIDYEYLWDIICTPNPMLFPGGMNLAIVRVPDSDLTQDVQLICPTNAYASTLFDPSKRTAIIMVRGHYYEPIVSLEDAGTEYRIGRRFRVGDGPTPYELNAALRDIASSVQGKCRPLPSMPSTYEFAQPLGATRTLAALRVSGKTVTGQLLGFGGLTIGLIVGPDVVVPCGARPPLPDIQHVLPDDHPVPAYADQLAALRELEGTLPVGPAFRMVDVDGRTFGILTVANQMLPVESELIDDEVPVREARDDYWRADEEAVSSQMNGDRVREISQADLATDTQAYNAFRSVARARLNDYRQRAIRERIQNLVRTPPKAYAQVLPVAIQEFKILVGDNVRFVEGSEVLESDTDSPLIVPRYGLATGTDNATTFYGRIADEALRYTRVRAYLFSPRAYLSVSDVGYNLGDDEIIIFQSLLTGKPDYYEGLVPAVASEFIHRNTYFSANPILAQAYSDDAEEVHALDAGIPEDDATEDCGRPELRDVQSTANWYDAFPQGSKEARFPNSPATCSFDLPLMLIRRHDVGGIHVTMSQMREVLGAEYKRLSAEHEGAILRVLSLQGKGEEMKSVRAGNNTLHDIVMSDDYYMTNLDLWIIAERFSLPIVLYAGTTLRENDEDMFVLTSAGMGSFYFVKAPAPKKSGPPSNYRMLVVPQAEYLVDVNRLPPNVQGRVRSQAESPVSVAKYLGTVSGKAGRPRAARLRVA